MSETDKAAGPVACAPDRIWAYEHTFKTTPSSGAWISDNDEAPDHSKEYIRADLALPQDAESLRAHVKRAIDGCSKSQDKQIEALDRAETAEAEIARLTAALSIWIDRAERAEAEVARLTAERQQLAEAICGGEDIPGLLAATSVEDLVDTARKGHRDHSGAIDARIKAERERDEALAGVLSVVRAEFAKWIGQMDPKAGERSRVEWNLATGLRDRVIEAMTRILASIQPDTEALEMAEAAAFSAGFEAGQRDEREACAVLIETRDGSIPYRQEIAEAIRKRGED